MREADFQTKFTRWAKYNVHTPTAFELKLAKSRSLPYSAVQDHQIAALLAVKKDKLCYKIPDSGIAQKPFDMFVLRGEAYVAVMFYERGQKEFFLIDVDEFISERDTSTRKSLTEQRAREIGSLCELKS